MTNRISTIINHQRAVSEMTRMQNDFAKLSQQISSGQKASTYTELGNDVTRVIDLDGSINRIDRYVTNNQVVLSRLAIQDMSMSQMLDITAQLSQDLAVENSSSSETFNLSDRARSMLDQVADALNVKQGGRSLFAGGKTNADAVRDLKSGDNLDPLTSGTNASYYLGDSLVFDVKASESMTLEYGITAADAPFQKLIAALHKAIDLDQTGGEVNRLAAQGFLEEAVDGLTGLRANLGSDMQALQDTNTQHQRVKQQLSSSLGTITETDIVEASIQIQLNETTLTATMQTFARISNLNLTEFLR